MAASLRLAVAVTWVCLALATAACQGQLEVGYYKKTCPRAEHIVRDEVKKFVYKDAGIGAGLIRLLFHDCFVQGCDGSVLLDPTPTNPRPEKLSPPNFPSLRGFEVIDAAKDAVEQACPGQVSCADIVAFAARDAAYFLSRLSLKIDVPAGRLDGRVSSATEALGNLPPPFANVTGLIGSFAAKGLDVEDMVVLSGAHTVGRSHCSSFVSDRLAAASDISASFAASLRRRCPASASPAPAAADPTVNQDVSTPNAFDNQYYKNVLAHRVLFTSDAALLATPATAKMVQHNANIPGWWEGRFKKAFVKMSQIEVKTTGDKLGEIRKHCRIKAACVVLLLLVAATTTTCQAAGAGGGSYAPPGPGIAYGLKVGYYGGKCPPAEAIVRRVVGDAVRLDPGVGAGLIRMLFHDCFVEGCDASVLLDPTPANPQPEKLAAPNNPSLRGFEVIDAAKAAVERACPGAVSCADIVAFAARDAAAFLSRAPGLNYFDMPAGRLDGRVSSASRALGFLPPPTFGLSQLVQSFAAKGLGVEDMVALSGAHTVGRSHCSSFVPDRLAAPSDIDASFAASLRGQCPATGGDPTVVQDAVTPDALDNQYYKNVLAHRVLFTSDASLLASPATAKMVSDNANIPGWWEDRFKAAMVKMAGVDVKTSNLQGETHWKTTVLEEKKVVGGKPAR
ncbi:hypothetical protein U9M48_007497 [Paspalum notatum var. saurae]|uniref:peroxidase n=1 Tax=Paspalum notatum var. saurae TaxID=547442 RepID=A0AAQ3PRX7_PASNO